jgi:hypothetical protein
MNNPGVTLAKRQTIKVMTKQTLMLTMDEIQRVEKN